MLHRALNWIRANYALGVFWAYLAAFGVAFLSIVVFPPAAIALVLVGLLLLIPAVAVGGVVRMLHRASCRACMRKGVCPACGQKGECVQCACTHCGVQFSPDGTAVMA